MRFLLVGLLVAMFAMTGCGGSAAKPGSAQVYTEISNTWDCRDLQSRFDRAARNHDRDIARGNVELAKVSTSYMAAANDRLEEVGCYG